MTLGSVRKYVGSGAKRQCVEKDETMMYVSILDTIDVLLQNETILSEVILNLLEYFGGEKPCAN